jgi:hypothetical protein
MILQQQQHTSNTISEIKNDDPVNIFSIFENSVLQFEEKCDKYTHSHCFICKKVSISMHVCHNRLLDKFITPTEKHCLIGLSRK